jgi:UDP-3-O-[3-hydroxymyristoyl] glucosamine N-acyltransferase
MKLSEIADRLGCKLVGDGGIEISAVAGLEQASAGELTFLSNPRYAKLVESTRASAILLEREIAGLPMAMLISGNPYLDFARALEFFYEAPKPKRGIHPTAAIAESARIGKNAMIGAYATIGENVVIGDEAVIHPHVTIYDGVEIGDRFLAHANAVVREYCRIGNGVILQNGVIVGGDGYGFAHRADGTQHKIPQAGIVVIEDEVEIQANSCIDRAAVGETRIRRGTKIDNLVQIGHAVEIGENNIICSQSGIAGSTTLGNNCILAGQVGVINHLKIGNNVLMTAKTGVGVDIPDGQKISGAPSLDNRQWLRCTAVYNRLPELDKTVKALKRQVAELAEAKASGESAD